jgi:hypothetical protein
MGNIGIYKALGNTSISSLESTATGTDQRYLLHFKLLSFLPFSYHQKDASRYLNSRCYSSCPCGPASPSTTTVSLYAFLCPFRTFCYCHFCFSTVTNCERTDQDHQDGDHRLLQGRQDGAHHLLQDHGDHPDGDHLHLDHQDHQAGVHIHHLTGREDGAAHGSNNLRYLKINISRAWLELESYV